MIKSLFMTKPKISVVVPTYRRPDLLRRCLQALVGQTLEPDCYEIIVVDDAPCETTYCTVSEFAALHFQPVIRYLPVQSEKHGPAVARNLGWQEARSEIIAFTDDDCLPAPDWLQIGLNVLSNTEIDGVSGRVVVPMPDYPTDFQRSFSGLEKSLFVTANCFYRKEILEKVGGFDEQFRLAWREDSDLYFKLLKAEHRLIRAPEAVVVHPVRKGYWGISLKLQRQAMYNALLYKKHPELYRQNFRVTPWHYYRNVGLLIFGIFSLIFGKKKLAALALSFWLLFTGIFCLQRLRGTSHHPKHIAEMFVTSAIIPPLSIYWRLRGAIKFRVFFL